MTISARISWAFLVFALTIFATVAAYAQDEEDFPDPRFEDAPLQETWRTTKPWTERDLVPHVLELHIMMGPTAGPALSVLGARQTFGVNVHHTYPRNNVTSLPIGLSLGVARGLEIGVALPIQLSPSAFGDLPVWLGYQLISTEHLRVGGRVTFYIPTSTELGLQVGIPVRVTSERIRFDTGAFVTLSFEDMAQYRIFAPALLGFRILGSAYVGAQTEFAFDVVDNALTFSMPLYGFIGYTVNGGLGPIDLGLRFGFDHFVRAGSGIEHVVEMRDFSFALGGNMSLQF